MSGMPVNDRSIRAGEDVGSDVQRVTDAGAPVRVITATTTVLFAGRGVLKRLVIEAALTGIVTIYDNTAASGTVLATLPVGFPAGVHPLGFECATGCTIVTAAADRIVAVPGL